MPAEVIPFPQRTNTSDILNNTLRVEEMIPASIVHEMIQSMLNILESYHQNKGS